MEHVVFFPTPDGTPSYRRLATLEDAVRLVEHLKNVEGVDQVSVHTLTDVPLSFKAYYRVEVPAAGGAPAVGDPAVVPEQAPGEPVLVAAEAAPGEPAPATLGYFAS